MDNTNAVAVINEYPPEKFNLLIPVKTLQEISPIHKVIINQIQVDTDPDKGGDVYKEKNGGLALTKKALSKMMAAANIQVIDSKAVTPQRCQRCADIAARTRLAPQCGSCPNIDDVAYQVTIAVPEPSGTWRMVRATKEIRMTDEKKKMSEKQYQQFFPYRTEQCETKALNRALREALMVKSTYTPAELQKPFAVAYVVPNLNDPDIKKAVAARYASSVAGLFGGSNQPQMLEAGDISQDDIIEVGDDGSTVESDANYPDDTGQEASPPWEREDETSEEGMPDDVVTCEGCAEIIEPAGKWTVDMIVAYSQKNFGEILCPKCQKERKRAGAKR